MAKEIIYRKLVDLKKLPDELYGFDIDWEKKEIWTHCGDPYYDYCITFAELAQFAKYIEKGVREGGKDE